MSFGERVFGGLKKTAKSKLEPIARTTITSSAETRVQKAFALPEAKRRSALEGEIRRMAAVLEGSSEDEALILHTQLGRSYAAIRFCESAISHFNEALFIRHTPETIRNYFTQAIDHATHPDNKVRPDKVYKDAIHDLSQLLTVSPDHEYVIRDLLGMVYLKQGNTVEALTSYEEALLTIPDNLINTPEFSRYTHNYLGCVNNVFELAKIRQKNSVGKKKALMELGLAANSAARVFQKYPIPEIMEANHNAHDLYLKINGNSHGGLTTPIYLN